MSVSNIEPLIRYKGDGAQTVFPIPYRFLEPEHIRVEIGRSGVTLLLAYLADYTVNESNVVTKVPPAAGDVVAISRETPQERPGDYDETGSVPGSSLNDNYDRAILMIQELASKLKRAVLMPAAGDSDATIQDLMDLLAEMLKQVTEWVTEAENAMKILDELDLSSLARLDSPHFTGVPTAPTAGKGTSTDQLATTKFVQNEVADFLSPNQSSFVASQWLLDQTSSKYYHRIVTDARDISHVYKNETGGSLVFDDSVEIHVVDEGYIKLVAAAAFDGHIVTLSKRLPVVYGYEPVKDAAGNILSLTLTGIVSNPGNITDLDLPSSAEYEGATYSVKKIGYRAFNGSRITSVNIGEGIEEIDAEAFYVTGQLVKVVFPSTLKTIGVGAFYLSGVAEFNLPEGLLTLKSGALDTAKLTSLHIPASVQAIDGYVGRTSTSFTSITVDSGNLNYSAQDGVLYTKDMKKLIQYPRGKTGSSFTVPAGVEELGRMAFYGVAALTGITLPAGLLTIGEECFQATTGITAIAIPASVQTINGIAFGTMTSLTAITVDSGNLNYTALDGVLYTKTMKTLVQYPNGKTGATFAIPAGVENIEQGAFQENPSLTGVTLPAGLLHLKTRAFSGARKLQTVAIPASVQEVGGQALARCPALTAITVDSGNLNYTAQDGVLYTKDMKTLVQYPNGKTGAAFTVPAGVETIGPSAFYSSTLTGVTFPAGLLAIKSQAFQSAGLTAASFPASVESFTSGCFYGCADLEEVTFQRQGKWPMDNPFSSCPKLFTVNGYPGSTAEDYAARYNYLFKSLEEA